MSEKVTEKVENKQITIRRNCFKAINIKVNKSILEVINQMTIHQLYGFLPKIKKKSPKPKQTSLRFENTITIFNRYVVRDFSESIF